MNNLIRFFTRTLPGRVRPPGGSGTTKYLREDHTWQVPPSGGTPAWGSITGTLSDQTDLQGELDLKANIADLGTTAFSNDYNDLTNLPSIPPADAQFIVAAAHAGLSAERVATDTSTITWDFGTAAQAKANVADVFLFNTGDVGTGVYDFGGADSFEIPNAASGTTLDAAGEITLTSTATGGGGIQGFGSSEFRLAPTRWNGITIENPTSAEDWSIIYTTHAVTVFAMRAVLRGSSTPSVTWTIRFSSDRSAAGTEVVTGGTTTTSTTTGSSVGPSFDDATIPSGNFIWLETTAKSGTVNELHVTIFYTIDPL